MAPPAQLGTVGQLAGGNAGTAQVAGDLVVRIDVLGALPGPESSWPSGRSPGSGSTGLAPAFDEGGLSTVRMVVAVDGMLALPGLALRLVPPGGLARSIRLAVSPGGRRTIVVQAVQTLCGVGPA